MKRSLLITASILILIGLVGLIVVNFFYFQPFGLKKGGFRRYPGRFGRSYDSNGEQIYFTGVSRRGSISSSGGPYWFAMHGGGCVDCHGVDGRGGRVTTMMGSFTAHDIRYSSLVKEKPPFTIDTIKRVITKGIDNKGQEVDSNMPHWNMSNRDLNDVINYLKSL
ncbi:MAG: hypothetical protein C4562_03805 [Actinobacteria bacterium]|nr:MAG: hypothetical protein C4562_03805 [Actinomycetota bacterium]